MSADLSVVYTLALLHVACCMCYGSYASLDLEMRVVRLPEEEHRLFFYYKLAILLFDIAVISLLHFFGVLEQAVAVGLGVGAFRAIGCLRLLGESKSERLREPLSIVAFAFYSILAPGILYGALAMEILGRV